MDALGLRGSGLPSVALGSGEGASLLSLSGVRGRVTGCVRKGCICPRKAPTAGAEVSLPAGFSRTGTGAQAFRSWG